MAVNFPDTLDEFTNPSSNSSVENPSHSQQHSDANDAIEALQAKVGVDNSTEVTSLDYRVRALETETVDPEDVQDIVGEMVSDNTETNLVVTYDAVNGKLNFSTGPDVVTTTSLENTLNDPATGYVPIGDVGSVDGVASLGPDGKVPASELNIDGTIQDVASAMITGATHTNISVSYDNISKLLSFTSEGGGANVTISSSAPSEPTSGDLWLDSDTAVLYAFDGEFWLEISGSGGIGEEAIQDIIGAMVSSNTETGLSVTYDDATGKLNFAIGSEIVTTTSLNTALSETLTAANEYADEAVASLGNTLPTTYVSLSDVGQADGVASLDPSGYVPDSELNIDERIEDVAAAMITGATHTNVSVSYDDTTGKLAFTAEGGGSGGGVTASATAPSPAEEGDGWFDTVNGKLYIYYDSYWVEAVASGATGPTGPMFLDYQGAWNSGIGYLENEGVTYIGSLWRLNVATSPAGTPPSAPNWQLIVQKGDKGDTGELEIGTVTTVTHGNPATVVNSGTSTDAVLDFDIPAGPAATITVGTVEDVLYGNPPTVTNSGDTSDAVFDFEIPAGRAATIVVGTVDDVVYGNPPTVTNSGDTSDAVFDFEIPAGRAATISVGTVTTVLDGNDAEVTNSGDTSDAVFDFTIPAGPRSTITIGDVVDVDFGTPPTVTNVGTTSDAIFDFELTTGRASTLAVGTVTTGSYASQASVTNVGTTSDAIFNFSIPQGIPGDFQPGENPPANPLAGQVWYNTTTGRAYVYYDSFWVEFSPGFVGPAGPAGPAGANGTNGADGADGVSWIPVEVSSNITLAKDNRYFVNTSAARTLTLPASPALNDEIQILDASGTASTYNITVDRNSNKINGGTGNFIIDMNGAWVTLLYTGSTYGWKVA